MLDCTTENSLKETRDILKLLTLFKKSKDGMYLEVAPTDLPTFSSKITIGEDINDWEKPYKLSEKALSICQHLDASTINLNITIEEILQYSKPIEILYELLTTNHSNLAINFGVDDDGFDLSKKTACIFMYSVVLGKTILGCFFAMLGTPEQVEDGQLRIVPENIIKGATLVAQDKQDINEDIFNQELEKFEKNIFDQGYVTLLMKS